MATAVGSAPGASDSRPQAGRVYVDRGLVGNTQYCYRFRARDGAPGTPNITGYSETRCVRTRAQVPFAPSVRQAGNSAVRIDLRLGWNAADTELALFDESRGRYLDASGNPSRAPVWRTDADWGVTTITGLAPGITYSFSVRALGKVGDPSPHSGTARITPGREAGAALDAIMPIIQLILDSEEERARPNR